jgi:hypothetical protein
MSDRVFADLLELGASRVVTHDQRARQAEKIASLRQTLVNGGFYTLQQQSAALGLGRSTTWTLLTGKHKNSGLSARVINRILAAPSLPPAVRDIVLEYVEEKLAGSYGHNRTCLERFAARLMMPGTIRSPLNDSLALPADRTRPPKPRFYN